MPHFVIDIGNTRIKLGRFEERALLDSQVFDTVDEMINYFVDRETCLLLISSVSQSSLDYVSGNLGKKHTIKLLNHNESLPFGHEYSTPETLGQDRIAAVAGARSLFQNDALLIIDIGTCITYDFIDHHGVYKGGGISPGLNMRFKALHEFTGALPMVTIDTEIESIELVGKSTIDCMKSGVANGCKKELIGTIDYYKGIETEFKIIVCGGGSELFIPSLKDYAVIFKPELVLIGINEILMKNDE